MRIERGNRIRMTSSVTGLLVCSLAGLAAMGVGSAQQTPPVVRVDSGQLQGVVDDGVASYKGVPFAAPPVGELRWRPPQPLAPWTGVRQATEFAADCMQGRFGPPPGARGPAAAGAPPAAGAPAAVGPPPGPAPSEDCLYLNVRRPANAAPAARLPVMVWIYGGGFHGRLELLAQHLGSPVRKTGRRHGGCQLPRGAFRVLRLPRVEPRAP